MFDCRDGTNIYQMVDIIDDRLRAKRRDEQASAFLGILAVLILGGIILLPVWLVAKNYGMKGLAVLGMSVVLIVGFLFIAVSVQNGNSPGPAAALAHASNRNIQNNKSPQVIVKPEAVAQRLARPVEAAPKPSFARIKRQLPELPPGVQVSPALRHLMVDPDGFYVAQVEYRTLRKQVDRLESLGGNLEKEMHPADLTRWRQLTDLDFQLPGFGCIFDWQPDKSAAR